MLSKEHKDLLQSFVNMQLICWSMVFGGSGVIGVTTKSSNMIIFTGGDSILSYLRWSCNEILISQYLNIFNFDIL